MNQESQKTHSEERYVTRPNLAEVGEMMLEAWARPCREYSESLLSSYINRPTTDPELSMAMYVGNRLAGFMNYTTYDMWFQEQPARVLIARFAASRKEFAGQHVGLRVVAKMREMIESRNFDGLFGVTESGSRASKSFQRNYTRMHYPVHQLKVFPLFMGMPRMIRRRVESLEGCPVQSYDTRFRSQCVEMVDRLKNRVQISRRIPEEDADFIFRDRPLTQSWLCVDGERLKGLLNVMRVRVLGKDKDSINAYIEHLLGNDMTEAECQSFLATVFKDDFWRDIEAVYAPDTGYFNPHPLTSVGFFRTPSTCDFYWVPFNERFQIETVDSFYLDVF